MIDTWPAAAVAIMLILCVTIVVVVIAACWASRWPTKPTPAITLADNVDHVHVRDDGRIDVWNDRHENEGKHHHPEAASGNETSG